MPGIGDECPIALLRAGRACQEAKTSDEAQVRSNRERISHSDESMAAAAGLRGLRGRKVKVVCPT